MSSNRIRVRCAAIAALAALGSSAACGAFESSEPPADTGPDASDASATGDRSTSTGDGATDPGDAAGDVAADAPQADGADAEAGLPPCDPDIGFVSVVELPELSDATSVRLKPGGAGAFYSAPEANLGVQDDLYEIPFPKGLAVPVHVAESLDDDSHPAPVTDDLQLFYEHGASGARSVVHATRPSAGVAFTIDATPAFAPSAGVQTREPYVLGDGSVVYFTMQPGAKGARDIYRASRVGAGPWSVAVVDGVSTALDEDHPVVSTDELSIFYRFNSTIWLATRAPGMAFSQRLPAAGVAGTMPNGSPSADRPTWLSPDRCTLLFISNRSGSDRVYSASRR